eukprot:Em0031g35a
MKTLLEAGATINQANKDRRTSLDLALEQGNNATIQLLKTYPNKVNPPTLVQSAENRAARDEQAPSNTKLQKKDLVMPQDQQTQEGAKKAEENGTPEQEILKPMQQNDMFQLQITHQAQLANERARIAEERATSVEQELSETKLHYETLFQQIRLQAQQADERARRAEERARTAEKEHLETKQQRDAMQ